jgi:hypothetical protein
MVSLLVHPLGRGLLERELPQANDRPVLCLWIWVRLERFDQSEVGV